MKTRPTEYFAAADAIRTLHAKATGGDFSAVESLADLARLAAEMLRFEIMASHPASRGRLAVLEVAAHSNEWPVVIPAVEETREAALFSAVPEALGSALGIRTAPKGRKRRQLSRAGQTRLAFDIHDALEARRTNQAHFLLGESWEDEAAALPPFSNDTLDQWAKCGWKTIKAEIRGKRQFLAIIPEKFLEAVKRRSDKEKISYESALKTESIQWLKSGFEQLTKEP